MERDNGVPVYGRYWYISTHTLTWSVTGELYALNGNYGDFNSHAHVERDGGDPLHPLSEKNFNSHAHVERDKRLLYAPEVQHHFNSHAHVERDLNLFHSKFILAFQLTRSRGA